MSPAKSVVPVPGFHPGSAGSTSDVFPPFPFPILPNGCGFVESEGGRDSNSTSISCRYQFTRGLRDPGDPYSCTPPSDAAAALTMTAVEVAGVVLDFLGDAKNVRRVKPTRLTEAAGPPREPPTGEALPAQEVRAADTTDDMPIMTAPREGERCVCVHEWVQTA